ncbi:DNA/RNA polymerases superfamily protein [Gossypium australe]|uniref:DNA/RNA polymerases superfamily protein n=1 Tax=Gossypium australe TaxID=47621 RepID=A0A5B6WV07_9ROSI|nr:DNA/RNA polymerases superfamily protein [Gossypium australe]
MMCLTCQRVKAEYWVPYSMLYALEVLEWKWGNITMDFVLSLPLSVSKKNSMVIQVLKVMLRSYVINFKMNWEKYLPLAEFTYNNNFHASLGMSPFEALYGKSCRSPVCWLSLVRRSWLVQTWFTNQKRMC